MEQGKKESAGKLNHELDFGFITQMAERMATNKGKYEPYNWQKPIDVEKLKQSLFRHALAIMEGIYEDDGRPFGHLEALAVNAMMINYQLKHFGKNESREKPTSETKNLSQEEEGFVYSITPVWAINGIVYERKKRKIKSENNKAKTAFDNLFSTTIDDLEEMLGTPFKK